MGFGVIEDRAGELSLLTFGVLKIKEKEPMKKLLELSERLTKLLKEHQPDLVGLEKLYFSKNKKTALEVSQARGVIANTLLAEHIPILEYGPGQVKVAVAGYGNADKESVAKMVRHILKLPAGRLDDNASDALAIAITAAFGHAQEQRFTNSSR